MLAGDLKSYINYFKSWATENPGINFFAFGSVEKGIDFARSLPDFDYPFCWLEQPVISSIDNDASHLNERYYTGICILLKAPLDDQQAQIDAYADALAFTENLHWQLRKDRKAGLIQFDTNTVKKESVSQLWIDGHYGFRMELQIDLNQNAVLFAK